MGLGKLISIMGREIIEGWKIGLVFAVSLAILFALREDVSSQEGKEVIDNSIETIEIMKEGYEITSSIEEATDVSKTITS